VFLAENAEGRRDAEKRVGSEAAVGILALRVKNHSGCAAFREKLDPGLRLV
jgi:hypothetical protein